MMFMLRMPSRVRGNSSMLSTNLDQISPIIDSYIDLFFRIDHNRYWLRYKYWERLSYFEIRGANTVS